MKSSNSERSSVAQAPLAPSGPRTPLVPRCAGTMKIISVIERPAELVVEGLGLSKAETADDLGRGNDLTGVALGVLRDVEHQTDEGGGQGLSPNGSRLEE